MGVTLGNLCEVRTFKLMTMSELAEKAVVAISVISRAEHESNISISSAKKIAAALNVELVKITWPQMTSLRKKKMTTYSSVRHAKLKGKIKRPDTCENCGKDGKLHAHHEDYSLPLDVVWLCPKCHKQRHSEIKRSAQSFNTLFFL